MQEFWVCDSCKSIVRKSATKCYSCGRPRAAEARSIEAGAPGAVLTPGVDDEHQPEAWRLSSDHRYISVRYLVPLAATLVFITTMVGVVDALVSLGVALRAMDLKTVDEFLTLRWLTGDIVVAELAIGLVEIVFSVCSAGASIALIAVSIRNAPVLGAGTPPSSPLAAIIWWFVPIWNLFRPYRIVQDLYDRLAVRGSVASKLVGAWWACFLLTWFVRVIGGFIIDLLAGFLLALGWVLTVRELVGLEIARAGLEALFDTAAGILFIRVILELGYRQRVRARWIAAGAAAGLDPVSAG